jgi:hypothetical protein
VFILIELTNLEQVFQKPMDSKGQANGLRYLRWGGDGEAVQLEK